MIQLSDNNNCKSLLEEEQLEQPEQPPKQEALQTNRKKALIFTNIFCVAQCFYQSTAKYIMDYKGVNALDLCFVRNVVMVFLASALVYKDKQTLHIPADQRKLILMRSMIGIVGFTSVIFGLKLLPVSIAQVVLNTAPIWTAIFGFFFLGDTISVLQIVALVCSFGGIILIAVSSSGQPVIVEGSYNLSEGQQRVVGVVLVSLTAVAFACVTIWTRLMQKMHYAVVVFYYSCLSVPVLGVALLLEALLWGEPLRILNSPVSQIFLMVFCSCFNAIGLLANTVAAQNEKPSFVTLVGYIGVFYSWIADLVVFHHQFTLNEIIGVSIILFFNILVVFRNK